MILRALKRRYNFFISGTFFFGSKYVFFRHKVYEVILSFVLLLKVNFGSKYMKYFLASCRAKDEHQILSHLAWCLNFRKKDKDY